MEQPEMTLKQLNNDRGIALLTALMMMVVILTIILGLMYLMDTNIKGTASQKAYRNVVEASYGGADLIARDIIPQLFSNVSTSTLTNNLFLIKAKFTSSDCLRNKLNNAPSSWSSSGPSCNTGINPRAGTDMSAELAGVGGQGFRVYTKIIDTTPGVPYSAGESQLVGGGVVESSAGTTLRLNHYVYRIEVSAEGKDNPEQKSNVSVVYEY